MVWASVLASVRESWGSQQIRHDSLGNQLLKASDVTHKETTCAVMPRTCISTGAWAMNKRIKSGEHMQHCMTAADPHDTADCRSMSAILRAWTGHKDDVQQRRAAANGLAVQRLGRQLAASAAEWKRWAATRRRLQDAADLVRRLPSKRRLPEHSWADGRSKAVPCAT